MKNKYLVTSALPYANGKLHIGHVAGAYLPADIFVKFLKMNDEDVIYICGTDEHGTPISIKADAEGVKPQDIVDRYHSSIKASFEGLEFSFDNFSGTARPVHTKLSQEFFIELNNNGFVTTKTNNQFYCEHDKRFLADRYVEGSCPHCGYIGARGDQCDDCGKLIDTTSLKDPKCKLCGNTPIIKSTSHWFLDLPKFEKPLLEWLESKKTYWKENVINFILSWVQNGLIERAVTRDLDWGVPVPIEGAEGKVLYVWLDAPIGYISSTIEWAEKNGKPELWKEYWQNPDTKLIHFIGKDNIPFHTIIWPATIMGTNKNWILPHDVPANEYLNLEGQQLSTSRNWAIWVEDFLKDFDGDLLRFYLASIAPENKDSDFSWKEFQSKINVELNNVLGNLANRTLVFAKKSFEGMIFKPNQLSDSSVNILKEADELVEEIKKCFSTYQVRKAVKLSMDIARLGNRYFDESKPWVQVKEDKLIAAETIWVCAELLRRVSLVLYPVIPKKMRQLRAMLKLNEVPNFNSQSEIISIEIEKPTPLFQKIDDKEIDNQLNILKEKAEAAQAGKTEFKDEIQFEDFIRSDLRIAEVLAAEKVKKSNKLLKIKLKVGTETRTVMSGIAKHYKAEEIIGKKVVYLANLKPRKIFGIESEGMILAASDEKMLTLLVLDKESDSGLEIS